MSQTGGVQMWWRQDPLLWVGNPKWEDNHTCRGSLQEGSPSPKSGLPAWGSCTRKRRLQSVGNKGHWGLLSWEPGGCRNRDSVLKWHIQKIWGPEQKWQLEKSLGFRSGEPPGEAGATRTHPGTQCRGEQFCRAYPTRRTLELGSSILESFL